MANIVYIFECNECKQAEEVKLPVEQRNEPQSCPNCATGVMLRSFKAELPAKRIHTWSAWCDSTREMLMPSYEDDKAYDLSLEEVKHKPKSKLQKEKERKQVFQELHEKVAAGVI